jgi:hypothetical protein
MHAVREELFAAVSPRPAPTLAGGYENSSGLFPVTGIPKFLQ